MEVQTLSARLEEWAAVTGMTMTIPADAAEKAGTPETIADAAGKAGTLETMIPVWREALVLSLRPEAPADVKKRNKKRGRFVKSKTPFSCIRAPKGKCQTGRLISMLVEADKG